jgi:hypothetical protein
MRRYPRINGPAVLPLFCLAPHGVFRASRITPRAVSSYLAFSPLPALRCQRTGGVFSVTLSVNARLGERCPRVFRGMLPYGVRTFLWRTLRLPSDHLPSRGSYHNLARVEPRISPMLSWELCFPDSVLNCLIFPWFRTNGSERTSFRQEGNGPTSRRLAEGSWSFASKRG